MSASVYRVNVEVDARWSLRWVRLMSLLAPLLGTERAIRWARSGALRLCRTRIAR